MGKFYETEAEFEEKSLALGRMSVGLEKETKATIVNKGSAPAVFYIAPSPKQYGVHVSFTRRSLAEKTHCHVKGSIYSFPCLSTLCCNLSF